MKGRKKAANWFMSQKVIVSPHLKFAPYIVGRRQTIPTDVLVSGQGHYLNLTFENGSHWILPWWKGMSCLMEFATYGGRRRSVNQTKMWPREMFKAILGKTLSWESTDIMSENTQKVSWDLSSEIYEWLDSLTIYHWGLKCFPGYSLCTSRSFSYSLCFDQFEFFILIEFLPVNRRIRIYNADIHRKPNWLFISHPVKRSLFFRMWFSWILYCQRKKNKSNEINSVIAAHLISQSISGPEFSPIRYLRSNNSLFLKSLWFINLSTNETDKSTLNILRVRIFQSFVT